MKYLGSVKTLKEALMQGEIIAKESGCAFVYEKALCGKMGKRRVCYRGWLDMDIKQPIVMSIYEWRTLKKGV